MTSGYAELHCHTNFSFLEGASHPEEIAARAEELGLRAVAVTDHDGLYGSVRFGRAARERGLAAIVGAEVTLADDDPLAPGAHLTLLVEDAAGYANLCRLLSRAQLAGRKGAPLAERLGVGPVATNTVLYARPEDRPLQDVLTCIKQHTSLDRAGSLLRPNGELYLKSAAEMRALFVDVPRAVDNTLRVAERCAFR